MAPPTAAAGKKANDRRGGGRIEKRRKEAREWCGRKTRGLAGRRQVCPPMVDGESGAAMAGFPASKGPTLSAFPTLYLRAVTAQGS